MIGLRFSGLPLFVKNFRMQSMTRQSMTLIHKQQRIVFENDSCYQIRIHTYIELLFGLSSVWHTENVEPDYSGGIGSGNLDIVNGNRLYYTFIGYGAISRNDSFQLGTAMSRDISPIRTLSIEDNAAVSRRCFLKRASAIGLLCGFAAATGFDPLSLAKLFAQDKTGRSSLDPEDELLRLAPRARYWISTATEKVSCLLCHTSEEIGSASSHDHKETFVKCQLCAQECLIREGERGGCNTRINIKGELRTLVYGRPISIHVDPIEKKPFYHFLPSSVAFSMSTAGCPLHCKFCQNWEISQARPEDYRVQFTPPERIVEASELKKAPIIAFTYNEPTVFTEYLSDIAGIARKKKLRSVIISCGFMKEEPLKEMCSVLDAIKIDLKGFSEDFYRNVCSAELKPVLRSIKQVAGSGVHLEIVNLVVPTLNDSDRMLTGLVEWVAGEVGPDVPVHFTRFHPDYKMLNLPPTPVATLEKAYDIAREKGLHFPYVGNVPGHPGNNTLCPYCGKIIVKRTGFFVVENHVVKGCCEYCNQGIAGVWM